MVKRLALAALALALASPAEAATSITTKATGAAGTLNVATDGTNLWGPVLIWDGTTWATVNAGDSGLTVHMANTTLPLPSGAAKESGGNLDSLVTLITALNSLVTTLNSYVNSPPPLSVNGANGTWSGLTPGVAQTGTVVAANEDVTSIGGTAVATGTGASNAGTQRVVISSDSPVAANFSAISSAAVTRATGTTAYTAYTAWANGTPAALSFTGVCRTNGGQVIIPEIDFYSNANPSATARLSGILWLFDVAIGTLIADDATFTIAAGDYANLTGNMQGFPFTLANGQASTAANSGVSRAGTNYHAQCVSGTTTIYGMVEVTNNYTPVSAEVLTVSLHTLASN